MPYAEGVGDRADLSLSAEDRALIQNMRERSKKLVVVIISGRPLVITGAAGPGGRLGGCLAARHRRPGDHRRAVWRSALYRQAALLLARREDQLPLGPVTPGAGRAAVPGGYGLK